MTATIIAVWLLIGQNQNSSAAPMIVVAQMPTVTDCESLRSRVSETFTYMRLRCFETRIIK